MKQIFTIAILLLLFACDEDKESVQDKVVDVEMKSENLEGKWALLRKVSENFVDDSVLVSIDTVNYDYELMLNEDGSLIWEGSVYQDWEVEDKKQKLSGYGDGIWIFEVDANIVDTMYIAKLYLEDVYTYEGSEYTESFDVVGLIKKLTNKEMLLELYRFTSESERHVDKFKFERVE